MNRLFTVGFLPPSLREQYGFAWRDRDERALGRWVQILRGARRVMPPALALWPEARRPGVWLAPPAVHGGSEAPR